MNKGICRLKRWLKANGASQADLAVTLKVSKQRVSNWMRGLCRPTEEMRNEIHAKTGVPQHSWFMS